MTRARLSAKKCSAPARVRGISGIKKMKDAVEVDYSKLSTATDLPELVMEPMPDTYKAERMLSRAELLGRTPERAVPAASSDRLVLFSNVQFIYELVLARMEVHAFHIANSLGLTMRSFGLKQATVPEGFLKRTAYFAAVGGLPSDYSRIVRYNQMNSVNQYLTHWIYPYKGKFHPQMVRAILNIIGLRPGQTVLDPFVGSGTTPLEAMLLGIRSIGIDASPLCVLQSSVKTSCHRFLEQIRDATPSIERVAASDLSSESSRKKLLARIQAIKEDGAREFLTLAYLVALSDSARRSRDFGESFTKNLHRMMESATDLSRVKQDLGLRHAEADIKVGDARHLSLPDESVDGVVTSPPYSIALDYIENDLHSLSAMGVDVPSIRSTMIGVRGRGVERPAIYNDDLRDSMAEIHRVLKSGSCAVIVIGDATYDGKSVESVARTIDIARELGFELLANVPKIIFGLYNVMQSESILFFRKALTNGN
jgi:SAM-dependent methyltransferase